MKIVPVEPRWSRGIVELWELAGLTRPWNDPYADLRRAADGSASAVLIGLSEERLTATVMVGHDGHRGWVYYLAVVPDARGRGHGRAMMVAAQAWLRERGVPKLNLMVRGDNDPAIGFYRALGFVADEVRVLSLRLDVGATRA
jgi:ribosomal protein S18 acetylase RimI-like enzyme